MDGGEVLGQTGVTIRIASSNDHDVWDRYVRQHSRGSFFHLAGWGKAARGAYGYEPVYVLAERGGAICGALPLIDVRAPLLGRSLISTAFTVGGGILADDPQTERELAVFSLDEAEKRKSRYVELRENNALGDEWLEKSGIYAGFVLEIPQDREENLKLIPRKRRAEVRKAIKSEENGEIVLKIGGSVEEFYKIYSASLRDHGTPVFPLSYLRGLEDAFGSKMEISSVLKDGQSVASLISFYDGATVLPYYIGAIPAARSARAAEFLYWSLMRRASEKGCRIFDFGRSKEGTGPYHFKKLWGAEPQPLVYRCRLLKGDEIPNVNPNNSKFAALVKIWRRLPLPVANTVGPLIAANFP